MEAGCERGAGSKRSVCSLPPYVLGVDFCGGRSTLVAGHPRVCDVPACMACAACRACLILCFCGLEVVLWLVVWVSFCGSSLDGATCIALPRFFFFFFFVCICRIHFVRWRLFCARLPRLSAMATLHVPL